jgi:hypothetical protein
MSEDRIYVLRDTYFFYCPGCREVHSLNHSWKFNGDIIRPTFTPSILVWRDAIPDAIERFKEYRKPYHCHSFITDGRIQFLSDCTHDLAGQTIDLPLFDVYKGKIS